MYLDSPYGSRGVHDQAAARLHAWYDSFMQKNAQPSVVKVGPHGYIHGWVKVGDVSDDNGKLSFNRGKLGVVSKNADGSHHLTYHDNAGRSEELAGKYATSGDAIKAAVLNRNISTLRDDAAARSATYIARARPGSGLPYANTGMYPKAGNMDADYIMIHRALGVSDYLNSGQHDKAADEAASLRDAVQEYGGNQRQVNSLTQIADATRQLHATSGSYSNQYRPGVGS